MTKNDVIIFDEEILYAAREINGYCQALSEMINSYCSSINSIMEISLKDQMICDKLTRMVEKMESVKPFLKTVEKSVPEHCRSYISDIDTTDQFLY